MDKKNDLYDVEVWRDIEGWRGIYQISNHGRVKSFKVKKDGIVLSNKNKNGWYISVVLCKKGKKSESIKIHTFVAKYFIKNPYNKPEVNHKDLNKQNNHYKNLEWVTRSENVEHAVKMHPAMLNGMKKYNQITRPKTVLQLSIGGCLLGTFRNTADASKHTGVCQRNIHQVAAKTEYKPGLIRTQAGGFKWVFKEDFNAHV